jgi:hypothetical protein
MTEEQAKFIHAKLRWIKNKIADLQGTNNVELYSRLEAEYRYFESLLDEAQARPDVRNGEPQTDVSAHDSPPKLAEFLLTALATTRAAEAMIGDLNERFADECKKFGRDRAVRLYWARTLRSLWPLLRRAIGKALKWGAVIAAARRLF